MDYASVVGWRNASKYAFVFLPPTLESTGRRNLHPKGCGNTRLSSRSQQNLFSPTDFLVSFQFIFYVKTQHGVLCARMARPTKIQLHRTNAKVGRLCLIVVFNMCAWVWMWISRFHPLRTSCQSWALANLSSSVITLCFNSLVVDYNYDILANYDMDALVALWRACVQVQVPCACESLCVHACASVYIMCVYVCQAVSVHLTTIYCDCICMYMHIFLGEHVLVSVLVCVSCTRPWLPKETFLCLDQSQFG